MPYRRLPQSNASRDRALTTCQEKAVATPPPTHPFSATLATELAAEQPAFLALIESVNTAKAHQTNQSGVVAPLHKVARFWVNHGYQALINACIRGQFPNSVKNQFGLTLDAKGGPDMESDAKLVQAATLYHNAETQRRTNGDTPISFPDLADIDLHMNAFKAANQVLSGYKTGFDNAQEALAAADPATDLLILRLWNAIEATYDTGDKPSMRRKCRDWGIVYVPSKGETPSGDDFSVIGEVKDSVTDLALGEVEVEMTNGSLGVSYITEADGMYYLQVVSSGSYTLTATLDGYVPFSTTVEVVEGDVLELNISLSPIAPPPAP